MGQQLAVEQQLDDMYDGISGYGVRSMETSTVNTTYGELTFQGAQTLIAHLHLGSRDVFIDVGCGVGKLAFQVAMSTPATVIGVEVVKERFDQAQYLRNETPDIPRDRVLFVNADATTFSLNHATVVYMCSTCFPERLIKSVVSNAKPGTRIVAATPLTGPVMLLSTLTLEASWSKQVPFYVYVRLPN